MAAPSADYHDEPNEHRPRSRSRGRGNTSLGGGKVKTGHRVHGMKGNKDKDNGKQRSGRSKSREPRKPKTRREYDTPFDDKGRCHYHRNVQLAAKKMTGGWKVLCTACPKCMEQKQDSGDERSIRSGRSAKSNKSAGGGGGDKGKGKGKKFDSNGCCVMHSHIQVAKKSILGGWKVIRTCPNCDGGECGLDDISVKSGRSGKSTSSRKSTKSGGTGGGKKNSRSGKSGKAGQSGRYGALPFDGDGYCCRHPSVQIAQKKMIGGFKIIHDVCPECAIEDGSAPGRKSKGGRNRSRSVSRGHRSAHNDDDDESRSSDVGEEVSTKKKKRIRVKNLKREDEGGRHGRYSGYVNDDHRPHGNGIMRYDDGNEWEGVWNEGSQVHGKMKKGRGKGNKEVKSRF
ncbi:hypothetical protein ACHAXR_003591 [Thalassiosira sp. AJA248-18]